MPHAPILGQDAHRAQQMIRRLLRIGAVLGVVGGLAYAITKLTAPQAPVVAPCAPDPIEPWVAPQGGGCPTSHPVKAKLASKIFHLPGMANYERTKPDRCYISAATAEADGLRAAKR